MAWKRLAGPAYIGSSAADILTTPSSGQMYVITHIRVVNKDSSQRTFTLYMGATGGSAGGTELTKDKPIAVAGDVDIYFPGLVMKNGDYLSGIASAGSALVITVMGKHEIIP